MARDGSLTGVPFVKGHAKLGGRAKGTRDRVTRDFIEVTRELLNRSDIQAAMEQKVKRDLRTAGAASFTSKLITVVHGDSLVVTGRVETSNVADPEARDRRLTELLASAMRRRVAGDEPVREAEVAAVPVGLVSDRG
jgi:hypothetical protein